MATLLPNKGNGNPKSDVFIAENAFKKVCKMAVTFFSFHVLTPSHTDRPPPPPSAAYMRQWIRLAFGTKPLSELVLSYCQLDPQEQTSVNFNQNTKFSFTKMHLKILSAKRWSFCPGRDDIIILRFSLYLELLGLSICYLWRCCVIKKNTSPF